MFPVFETMEAKMFEDIVAVVAESVEVLNRDSSVLMLVNILSCFCSFPDTLKSHNGPGTDYNFKNCEYCILLFFF